MIMMLILIVMLLLTLLRWSGARVGVKMMQTVSFRAAPLFAGFNDFCGPYDAWFDGGDQAANVDCIENE